MLGEDEGQRLLEIARDAIAVALGVRGAAIRPPDRSETWLLELAATFVTITRAGDLHGCIGSIEPRRSLFDDVRQNAVAAALHDPRAVPLLPEEIDELRIEVSLLSALEPMEFDSEEDALAQLRPDQDGVVFSYGGRRATFLPQVWASLRSPVDFMAHLKVKAGFPADFWSTSVKLSRYSLQKWMERASVPPARPARTPIFH